MGQEDAATGSNASGVNSSPVNFQQITGGTGDADDARGTDGRFQPGRSGNPAGRPRGSRDRATIIARAILDVAAPELMRTLLERALYQDDAAALRLCVQRLLPPRRSEPVELDLPPLTSAADATKALAAIAQAVAEGELGAAEAGHLSALVDRFVHSLEAQEFEQRLAELEAIDAKYDRHA
jgi:hypothetical protein